MIGRSGDAVCGLILTSKSPRQFLGLGLKTNWASVYRLCHKTDRGKYASRSSSLLRMEASRARVSQSDLKTGRGATTGGACDIIVEIMWS
jgi:hypothetical protein